MEDEIQRAKKILNQGLADVTVYERLNANPDWQFVRKQLIEDKLDPLFDLSTEADDNGKTTTGVRIRGQLEALRGLLKQFDMVLASREAKERKLKQLS